MDNGSLLYESSGDFDNNAGAVLTVGPDAWVYISNNKLFENSGTVNSSGTFESMGWIYNHSGGVFNVQGGELSNIFLFRNEEGAVLNVTGGRYKQTNGYKLENRGITTIHAGGTLDLGWSSGAYNYNEFVVHNGGVVSGCSTCRFENHATVTIGGTFDPGTFFNKSGGTCTVTDGGMVSPKATLINYTGATLNIDSGGTVEHGGVCNNEEGALINNEGSWIMKSSVDNFGLFINSGSITNPQGQWDGWPPCGPGTWYNGDQAECP